MSKESTFTIRVETDLRANFVAATKHNNRPASQVLRDFMRYYIEHTAETAPSFSNKISSTEVKQRRQASDSALASVKLEGLDVPAETLAESERFIKGEIEFSELIRRLYEQAAR